MIEILILTYAVLIGLTPLIPLPLADDLAKTYFYRGLVQSLAKARGVTLSPPEVGELAEANGRWTWRGLLAELGTRLIKRLMRKAIFFLEARRVVDLVTHAYYTGYLLDYAFRAGWYTPAGAQTAARLRVAIDEACHEANLGFFKKLVGASFGESRHLLRRAAQQVSAGLKDAALHRSRLWLRRTIAARLRKRNRRLARWLYRRLSPTEADLAQMAQMEAVVAEKLGASEPEARQTLQGLVAGLQAGIARLPRDQFGALENRLTERWQAGQAGLSGGRR